MQLVIIRNQKPFKELPDVRYCIKADGLSCIDGQQGPCLILSISFSFSKLKEICLNETERTREGQRLNFCAAFKSTIDRVNPFKTGKGAIFGRKRQKTTSGFCA